MSNDDCARGKGAAQMHGTHRMEAGVEGGFGW